MPSTLSDALFWVAVALCAVAQAAILRSALAAHHTAAAPGSTLPPLRRAVEVAWTVVPAIALAALLVFTWRAMHPPVRSAPAGALPLRTAAAASGAARFVG
jgi:heme/copper-type cytochrome/quinol oxidase subunit 2